MMVFRLEQWQDTASIIIPANLLWNRRATLGSSGTACSQRALASFSIFTTQKADDQELRSMPTVQVCFLFHCRGHMENVLS